MRRPRNMLRHAAAPRQPIVEHEHGEHVATSKLAQVVEALDASREYTPGVGCIAGTT